MPRTAPETMKMTAHLCTFDQVEPLFSEQEREMIMLLLRGLPAFMFAMALINAGITGAICGVISLLSGIQFDDLPTALPIGIFIAIQIAAFCWYIKRGEKQQIEAELERQEWRAKTKHHDAIVAVIFLAVIVGLIFGFGWYINRIEQQNKAEHERQQPPNGNELKHEKKDEGGRMKDE